jgi:hypothetical protein
MKSSDVMYTFEINFFNELSIVEQSLACAAAADHVSERAAACHPPVCRCPYDSAAYGIPWGDTRHTSEEGGRFAQQRLLPALDTTGYPARPPAFHLPTTRCGQDPVECRAVLARVGHLVSMDCTQGGVTSRWLILSACLQIAGVCGESEV